MSDKKITFKVEFDLREGNLIKEALLAMYSASVNLIDLLAGSGSDGEGEYTNSLRSAEHDADDLSDLLVTRFGATVDEMSKARFDRG